MLSGGNNLILITIESSEQSFPVPPSDTTTEIDLLRASSAVAASADDVVAPQVVHLELSACLPVKCASLTVVARNARRFIGRSWTDNAHNDAGC